MVDLSVPPRLSGLPAAVEGALDVYAAVADARSGFVNAEGGDVASTGSTRSLVRHVANYLAALRLVEQSGIAVTTHVDVGGGVGALGVWLAGEVGAAPVLVDADPQIRALAGRAFPHLRVESTPAGLPERCAGLVTGMEVLEHIPPEGQEGFLAAVCRLVAPGGLLVLSTPDERGYLGGWSGYAPHIGVVTAERLTRLLALLGLPFAVWRLEGGPFDLTPAQRLLEPVGNRAVALADRVVPAAVRRAGDAAIGLAGRLRGPTGPGDRVAVPDVEVRAVPPDHGHGSGLIAAVHRPRTS